MTEFPIPDQLVNELALKTGLKDPGKASIREIVNLVNLLEKKTGIKFIRMDMGVPGLPSPDIAVTAEINALQNGVASRYPAIEGVAELKMEASRFVNLFLDVEVSPAGCLPTCGSMQASFICFLTLNRIYPDRQATLFIDPGFPVHTQQIQVLGHKMYSFDIYDFRGKKLRDKLKSEFEAHEISTMLYSNPNNPSWICLDEEELKIIADTAGEYGVTVIEDLAYFGMDFRKDISEPGKSPFQSTVAKYTDNYVLLLSASKIFSYAGQRLGILVMSDTLFNKDFPELVKYHKTANLGHAAIYSALYATTAGVTHSAQMAVAKMLKEVNDNHYKLTEDVRKYGERARFLKHLFVENGFRIVYDKDQDVPIADGFYFTVSYPEMSGSELLKELLNYGISTITLDITGSTRTEGLRICVSQTGPETYDTLKERLSIFRSYHK